MIEGGLQDDRLLRLFLVIVVTSFALSGDEQKAMDAGASAYIAKPYSPRELGALIRTLAPE